MKFAQCRKHNFHTQIFQYVGTSIIVLILPVYSAEVCAHRHDFHLICSTEEWNKGKQRSSPLHSRLIIENNNEKNIHFRSATKWTTRSKLSCVLPMERLKSNALNKDYTKIHIGYLPLAIAHGLVTGLNCMVPIREDLYLDMPNMPKDRWIDKEI